MEVFPRPQHVPLWADVANGKPVDWDHLFEGFASTVDWPSTFAWRELIARCPDAKIIHTERDPDVWWTSFSRTIKERLESDAPSPKPNFRKPTPPPTSAPAPAREDTRPSRADERRVETAKP